MAAAAVPAAAKAREILVIRTYPPLLIVDTVLQRATNRLGAAAVRCNRYAQAGRLGRLRPPAGRAGPAGG
jgi:hypothetical protein